jgi:hypothetical protein
VSEDGLHLIDDELGEGSIESWILEGLAALEAYLRTYAAFDAFLDGAD